MTTATPEPTFPRVLSLCALAFLVMFSYEIARPSVESLFLSRHSHESLPTVWLLVALGAAAAVAIYNRFAARVPLVKLLGGCALVSAGLLVVLQLAWARDMPGVAYALYVWKDVYIVVLVEVFWSFANTIFPLKAARWVYGLFCAAGSTGAIAGARTLRTFAVDYGTETLLWLVVPILAVLWMAALLMNRLFRRAPDPTAVAPDEKPDTSFRAGLEVMRGSRYLVLMLFLIFSVQLVVTLVDYQFNGIVQADFPDKDVRTTRISMVYEWISYGALSLQLFTGVVIKFAGVAGTLVGIPLLIAGTVVALIVQPAFAVAAVAKVAGKVFDYSLFRAAKEMLYLPLGYAEKTQGKAIIDMLGYRVAKGGVALLLKGLVLLGVSSLVSWLTLACVMLWLGLSVAIAARYQQKTALPAEVDQGA